MDIIDTLDITLGLALSIGSGGWSHCLPVAHERDTEGRRPYWVVRYLPSDWAAQDAQDLERVDASPEAMRAMDQRHVLDGLRAALAAPEQGERYALAMAFPSLRLYPNLAGWETDEPAIIRYTSDGDTAAHQVVERLARSGRVTGWRASEALTGAKAAERIRERGPDGRYAREQRYHAVDHAVRSTWLELTRPYVVLGAGDLTRARRVAADYRAEMAAQSLPIPAEVGRSLARLDALVAV